MLLADRPGTGGGGRRGTAPDLMELLPQWLATANARGYAPPPQLLPALLDAARGRTDLRPAALAFAGPRAMWLARLNPDWRFALRATPGGGTALPRREDTGEVRRLWEEGLFAERVALLSAMRAREPAAAREFLTTTWATERAEDRLMFLDSLRTGSDRAGRTVPGAGAVRPQPQRTGHGGGVAVGPAGFGAGGADGGPGRRVRGPRPHAGTRRPSPWRRRTSAMRAWSATASSRSRRRAGVNGRGGWASWWRRRRSPSGRRGSAADAREIVALPVADDWRSELHAAWCRAAVRQRDAEWARALLGAPAAPEAGGPGAVSLAERSKLLGTLGSAERAGVGGRIHLGARPVRGVPAARGVRRAVDEPLGRAVVDALNIARDAGSYPWSFSGVMGLAERCLYPSEASRLDGLLAVPDEPEDASPGAGGYWAEAFQRLVTTLRLRAAMAEELGPPDTGR